MVKTVSVKILVAIAIVAAVFLSGPKPVVDTELTFDPSQIGADPSAYLAESEKKILNIRAAHEKEIVWAYPQSRAKTPVSLVYIHGFSASKGEIRPLPDIVAKKLGANLFYSRLTGHGRDGDAMAESTVNAWINDFAEAMAIGRAIGERVVVIATSTGASLATWAATSPELMQNVAGMVLFSPNYRTKASGSGLLTLPWGEQLAELIIGKYYSFNPANAMHEEWWTTRYPARALVAMAALTELARGTDIGTIGVPVLFIFSMDDAVVDASVTKAVALLWGAPAKTVIVANSDDPSHHVIAGDALSPSTTLQLAEEMEMWVGALR